MANTNPKNGGYTPPNQMMRRRTLFLMIVCGLVAFIALGIRLFYLQIVKHDEYETMAIEQQVRDTTVNASRGTIYDRNGKILAMSASVDTIYLSPWEIKQNGEDPELIADGLSEILGVDRQTLLERMEKTESWYQPVAYKVEAEVSDKVREFKAEHELIGIKLQADTKRYYPYSSLAAHVVGYVGFENKGLSGVELACDSVLSGVNGRVVRATNAYGTDLLYTNFEDYYDAEDGSDVTLTIDANVQHYLEKHLQQAVSDYGVKNGAAGIVMDVNTGEIIAMASLGNFDLNDYDEVSEEAQAKIDAAATEEEKEQLLADAQFLQWRNKALSDTYEPGSTFKIITLAMALEEGKANVNSSYWCGGAKEVLGRTTPVKCWKTAGHGSQTLTQAVQQSCNCAFVEIGLSVGAEAFYKYAEAFGFFTDSERSDVQLGGKTGIELGGEASSIWWSKDVFCDSMNYSQLAAASFGQTFNITPIQLITAVSACVNGGNLMQPYVVKEIRGADGDVISATDPTVLRQVVSQETSDIVCQILEQVVGDSVEGTGKNAYVAGYHVGGKTGTTTKTTLEVMGTKEYIVSFLGVAPMTDPQYAVLVLLDNPSSDSGTYISGGNMAAPTVGNIFADILPALGVEADYSTEEQQHTDKSVPNLIGMTADEARTALAEQGLSCRTIGDGSVITDQLPRAGAVVAASSEVILYLEATPDSTLETVPNLTGLSYSIARQRLAYQGLFIRAAKGVASDSATVVVSGQNIEVGAQVEHGTVIEVTLVDNDTSMYGRY